MKLTRAEIIQFKDEMLESARIRVQQGLQTTTRAISNVSFKIAEKMEDLNVKLQKQEHGCNRNHPV